VNERIENWNALLDADIAQQPGIERNSVVLTCGTDLQPEPVRWLWQSWLALG
jgi:putative DNA primase/helicase